MAEENEGPVSPEQDDNPNSGAENGDTVGSADTAAEPAAPEVTLEGALAEVATLKERSLRLAADADNARRRATKDVENAHKFALEGFVNDLLPVLDSLDAAVSSRENADADDAVAEGIELARKLFLDTLKRRGVERVEPTGEPFDPQQHQAMAMVESPDAEPNSVLAVMQPGYLLNGRVVRAAMVTVSKAPTPGQVDETV